jgi:hypothetical protein
VRWILQRKPGQTGDEHHDTGRDVENQILPLMRENAIRLVQVVVDGRLAEGAPMR